MKQPSSSSLNQQVASTSTTTTTKTTLLASQIPTINTSKATRTNRSKLKSKSVSIIYSVLFLTSFTRVTVSSFTLPLPTAITTRTSSTAVAMTSRNLRNNNASLYKKHDDDDASNLYSNLLTSSSSLGVTRRVPHVHAMQMQSNSNDNHSRTSSNLNGNLNNKKGFSSSPGSNSNVNGNVSSNKRTGAGARTGSKRRQAAKTVSSLFSSFPLYFSKSSDGDIGDDSNMNGNSNDNGNSNGNTATISQLQQENKILRETISQLEDDNHRLEKRHAKQRIIVEQFEGEGYGDVVESAWWGQEGNGNGNANANANANVNVIDDDSRAVTAPVASTKRHVQFGDPESQTLNLGLTHRERGMASAGDDRSRASSITTSSGQIPGQVQVQSFQIQDGLQEQEECDVDVEDDGGCPIEPDISFKAALKDRAYWLVGLLTLQSMSGLILARNELLLQTHPVIIYFLTMLVGAGGNAGNQAAVRGTCVLNYF